MTDDQAESSGDAKFCTSCGEQIKAAAEICPHCGVRQMSEPLPDEQSDPRPKKNKRRRKFAWLLLFIVVVIWFATQNSGSDDGSGSSDQPEIGGTTSQSSAPVSAPVYEGCDGLEDLIPKLKSVGGSSLTLYQAVSAGNDAACNRIIEGWNKPENLKD